MNRISTSRLMIVAIIVFLLYGMMASTLGTLMPGFHLAPNQNGQIALSQALGLMFASVLAGPLIDNRGKKLGMLLGLVLIIASLAGLALANRFLPVLALMFLFGLGGGTVVTGANTVVSDLEPKRRGSMLNFAHVFFGLGGLLTPLIAANLLRSNTAHLCFLMIALALVTVAFDVFTPMPPPSQERGFSWSEVGRLERKPVLAMVSFFVFLYVACEVGFWNWLPRELMVQGISRNSALDILSLGFALGLVGGRLTGSRLLLKFQPVNVSLVCAVLMAGATGWGLLSTRPDLAWIAVFCAGLAMGPVYPSSIAIAGDAFPRMTATCIGVVITSGWIGLAASSWIIGDLAGSSDQLLPHALLLIPVFSLLMVATGLLLRRQLGTPRAQSAAG